MNLPNHLIMTGSRRVLTGIPRYNKLLATADYDYACADTPKNIDWLVSGGYVRKEIQTHYMDDATTGVWELGTTQVATKKMELWLQVIMFWKIMQDYPELFVDKIWKRGGVMDGDHDSIRNNINTWLKMLSVSGK